MAATHQDEQAAGELLAAALTYAATGLLVLPLDGKVPRNRGGLTNASSDPEVVADWWRRWPDANVGIRTGTESGLVALDVDTPKGGAGTLAELERKHGKLAKTARVLTGGGGEHIYFKHPGREVRNSAGRLGAGLDVRGDGGYLVVPPSIHDSGRVYKWIRPLERGIADPPAWLLDDPGASRNGSAPPVGDAIPQGERDTTLASLAGTMRRRGMGEAEILAALKVANTQRCRPPLEEREVERIAASISRYRPKQQVAPTGDQEAAQEPFRLEVLSARDLCALPDPPASDELLGPLLVRGQRLVLGAHTGEGKTTCAFQAIRAVVLGTPFLEWTGRGEGRALILDAEQGLRSVKRRLRESCLDDCDQVDYVRVPDGLALDT